MPGTSTRDGNDGPALGTTEDGAGDGVAVGAVAGDGDGIDALGDGAADGGGAVRAGCVSAGSPCGPRPVALAHADSAAVASSVSVSSKSDKRRTKPPARLPTTSAEALCSHQDGAIATAISGLKVTVL
jgi:hypothetical protein